RTDGCHTILHTDRRVAVRGRPVAKLPLAVLSPAPERSRVVDAAGVVCAERELDPRSRESDGGRPVVVAGVSEPELPVAVLSPAVRGPRCVDQAAVLVAEGHRAHPG